MTAYIEVIDAEAYFSTRMGSEAWDGADDDNKYKALLHATRLINALSFIGDKTEDTQGNEFPRGEDADVPEAIQFACCEIALKLLDGYDPDMEAKEVSVKQNRFASVITDRETAYAPAWMLAGIPSNTAWNYLMPFLLDPNSILLTRVN